MPELPEVETLRRGLAPLLAGRTVAAVTVRQGRLRWPVEPLLAEHLGGQTIGTVRRRGKYLLLAAGRGTVLVHLGMSGRLRLLPAAAPPGRHDHVDIVLDDGRCLRFTDPRRFGALLWTAEPPEMHPLLRHLGPEPLGEAFTAAGLHAAARRRRLAVKSLIMDSRVVAGVGNIYANEALFLAGIRPDRAAGRIAPARYGALVGAIRAVLEEAIRQGGTTLRDFVNGAGQPGYFQQQLRVYGRAGQPCPVCAAPLRQARLGGRSTCYCPRCQR
ncbi:MAG: bifunctional DNA-formamidopyrimidine glycosylase/DNA-(apurinic or apyrimidinic site) lyase [Pseudomonadota bacterium]|nr:bifunctional DNA-formamidopyrimidine glycosylase/DNA-(apurinic or apyrimidinic site) lyase [Pseudomonadota bacterium]